MDKFIVLTVTRGDLKPYIPDKQKHMIKNIPDDWMVAMADFIGEALMSGGDYWSAVEMYSKELIDEFMVCHCCGEYPCTCEYGEDEDPYFECPTCTYNDRCAKWREAQ